MAFQLKTTGIAANCSFCLAVDQDGATLKEFASSDVNANMTVGADITFGTQTWDGITRPYWVAGGSGATAKYVLYPTGHRPVVSTIGGYTLVVIYSPQGTTQSYPLSLGDGANWFSSFESAAAHPHINLSTVARNGAQTNPAASSKTLYGWRIDGLTSLNWFTALHDAGSITTGSATAFASEYTVSPTSSCYNDGSTDRWHAIMGFDAILSDAEIMTLVNDWQTVMLETAGGGGPAITGPNYYYGMISGE